MSACFPVDAAYIGAVRLLAAGLGARCDLTLDDIEDLRLAIDEACVLLLASADADGSLEVRFELTTRCVGAELSATGAGEPDRRGLSWAVLAELASTVAVTSPDGRVVIALSKRREDVSR